jgi:acyl carrier protein
MSAEETIKDILYEELHLEGFGFESPDDIKPEHIIADDLRADSLDTIQMLMYLEEKLDVEVPDSIAELWKTVGDVCKYFEE